MDVAAKVREQYAGPRITEVAMLAVRTSLDRTIQRLATLRDRYATSLGNASASAETLRTLAKQLEVDLDDRSIPEFNKAVGAAVGIAKQQVAQALSPISEFMRFGGDIAPTTREEREQDATTDARPRGVTTRNPKHSLGPEKLRRPAGEGEGEAGIPAVSTKSTDPAKNGEPAAPVVKAPALVAAPQEPQEPSEPGGEAPTGEPPGKD